VTIRRERGNFRLDIRVIANLYEPLLR